MSAWIIFNSDAALFNANNFIAAPPPIEVPVFCTRPFSLLISILIKPYIVRFIFGYFDVNQVRKTSEYISKTSFFQKSGYLLIMFLSHQFIINFIDIFSFENIKSIINKTLISSIISILFSYIIILIFFRKNAR